MTACVSAHCMLLHYVKTLLLQDILRLPLSRLSVHTSVRSPAPVGGPAPPTGGGSFELLPRRPGQRRPVAKRSWELAEQEGAGALSLFLSFFLSFFFLSLSLSLSLFKAGLHTRQLASSAFLGESCGGQQPTATSVVIMIIIHLLQALSPVGLLPVS